MQQNIVNENKYTGFGTKKIFSSITKIDKDSASERNPALEKSIEVFGNIGKTFGKMFILVIAGIFTVFPFIWMIISALISSCKGTVGKFCEHIYGIADA